MILNLMGDVYLNKRVTIDFMLGNYFIFNLEAPISKRGTPFKNKVNLRLEKSFIFESFGSYPKAVCLANNHIMDYGIEAFNDTLEFLASNSIKYFGAGNKSNNYNNPYILEFGDKRIAILGYACESTHFSYTDGTKPANLIVENVIKDIKEAKKNSDYTIIQFHWGDEEIPFPKFSDVETAHRCIEAGADLIIGHHAHVIQSHEIYKGKHIFYGIGNFIFPDLNEPSKYDGEKFTKSYIKKQNRENRQSIVVTLNKELEVDFFTVEFDHNMLKKRRVSIPKWIPNSDKGFKKKYTIQKKINMVKKFVRNPKIPNQSHLKRFFGV